MRRFGDRVFYLAYFYLGDRLRTQEIAQEVFLRVYTGLDVFRGESSYFTWIYSTTANLCRKQLRSRAWKKLFFTADEKLLDRPATSAEEQALQL